MTPPITMNGLRTRNLILGPDTAHPELVAGQADLKAGPPGPNADPPALPRTAMSAVITARLARSRAHWRPERGPLAMCRRIRAGLG
jgi:hypothetical protein